MIPKNYRISLINSICDTILILPKKSNVSILVRALTDNNDWVRLAAYANSSDILPYSINVALKSKNKRLSTPQNNHTVIHSTKKNIPNWCQICVIGIASGDDCMKYTPNVNISPCKYYKPIPEW